MTAPALSFVLDGVIILLLAGTIFYCARLSVYLRAFRDSRSELESLLTDLSGNVTRAEGAIEGLRQSARESGRDLQELINQAKGLSEELQIMSESGNRLAGRLEKLAEGSGARVSAKNMAGFELPPRRRMRSPVREPVKQEKAPSLFAIRDREFEEDAAGEMDHDGLMSGDYEEDESAAGGFASRAEQELYEALRRRKTEAGGVS